MKIELEITKESVLNNCEELKELYESFCNGDIETENEFNKVIDDFITETVNCAEETVSEAIGIGVTEYIMNMLNDS